MNTRTFTKLATLGTQHAMLRSRETDFAVNGLVSQIASDREVAQLLIAVASEKLRQKAGYCPAKLPIIPNMAACKKLSSRTLRDKQAIDHLKQMVIEREWDWVLPEWCLYLALSGQHAPEELVPDLLNYGTKVPIAQEFLMLVMGDRARWMAEALERPEWLWATFTPILNMHLLALQERWKEPQIIANLYDRTLPTQKHPALIDLATLYYSFWSNELADAFLYFIVTRSEDLRKYYMTRAMREWLIEAVVRFPLNRSKELLKLFESWTWHHEEMTQLFDFRRKMITAIYRGKEALLA
jgi:hypothetical protein